MLTRKRHTEAHREREGERDRKKISEIREEDRLEPCRSRETRKTTAEEADRQEFVPAGEKHSRRSLSGSRTPHLS